MIMPIDKVDSSGIYNTVQNQSISFKFITPSRYKLINELNNGIILKEKQLNYLQKEIYTISIEQQLQNNSVKEKRKNKK